MASSIINYIVENYLAQIIEIDPEQTKSSLWSGTFEICKGRLKRNIFQTFNIPHFELVDSSIGKISASFSLPFVYAYPIKVNIDKVFIHIKQRKLENRQKEEEIEDLEAFKLNRLQSTEAFTVNLNEIGTVSKGYVASMVSQALNNLQISISDIFIKYDDAISSPLVPYSFGILLKKMIVKSTTDSFKEEEDELATIPIGEINHKLVKISNLGIFLDTYKSVDEMDYKQALILQYNTVTDTVNNAIYDQYCMNELTENISKEDSHQYLLFNMGLTLKTSINDNLKNGHPQLKAECDLSQLTTKVSLKQIAVLLKLMSYMDLNNLYRIGIAKMYYTKALNEEQKKEYVEHYTQYYNSKYIKTMIDAVKMETYKKLFEVMEKGLTFDQIQSMRSAAKIKIDYENNLKSVENEINTQLKAASSWNPFYWGAQPTEEPEEVKKLRLKQSNMKENETEINRQIEEQLKKEKSDEAVDLLASVSDDFTVYQIKFSIPSCITTIIETDNTSLISILFSDFEINGDMKKKGQLFTLSLGDIKVSQFILENTPYSTLFETVDAIPEDGNIGEILSKTSLIKRETALYLEFENNPNLPLSNYRFKFRNSKQILVTLNIYSLQYCLSRLMESFKSAINIKDLQNYAMGMASDYIQAGYVEKFMQGEYHHFNIDLDIQFTGPIILIPQNILYSENKKCIMIRISDLIMNSKLPPRQDFKNAEYYIHSRDEEKMYDKYSFKGNRFYMATIEDYNRDAKTLGKSIKWKLIEDIELQLNIMTLIEPKNKVMDAFRIKIIIPKIQMIMRDMQLVYLIDFYDGYMKINKKLELELEKDIGLEKKQEEKSHAIDVPIDRIKEEPEEESKDDKDEDIMIISRQEPKIELDKPIVKETKNFFVFEFILEELEMGIQKKVFKEESPYTDKAFKEYLTFFLKNFSFNLTLTEQQRLDIALSIKSIEIQDNEVKYTQNGIEHPINDHFISIIKSSKMLQEDNLVIPQQNYFDIHYTYNPQSMLTKIDIIMNKLQLCFNYYTLLRLWQFYKHFYGLYLEMLTEHINDIRKMKTQYDKYIKLKKKEAEVKPKDDINKDFISRLKKMSINPSRARSFLGLSRNRSLSCISRTKTTKQPGHSKMIISFVMKEIEMLLPLVVNTPKTKITRFHYNLLTQIEMVSDYVMEITPNTKQITAMNYSIKNMNINVMLYNIDFDIIKYNTIKNKQNPFSSKFSHGKIISNFRINTSINSFLLPSNEKNVMNIQVKLEPLSSVIGFKQVKMMQYFMNSTMDFLWNMAIEDESLYYERQQSKEERKIMKNTDVYQLYPKKKSESRIDLSIQNNSQEASNKINRNLFRANLAITTAAAKMKEVKQLINSQNIFQEETQKAASNIDQITLYNYSRYNYQMDITFQLDKISLKLIDDLLRIPLLNIESNKVSFKYISNSDPNDERNIANALVEIISGKDISISEYNVDYLFQYMDASFNVEINYFNDKVNDWEPIMEPWYANLSLCQVAKFTPLKIGFTSKDILNFNLSVYSVKVFNEVMKKIYSEDKAFKEERRAQSIVDSGEELALDFCNYTGMNIECWLDANPSDVFSLGVNQRKKMTRNQLARVYRQLNDKESILLLKDKFSFRIEDCAEVNKVDFSYSNYTNYMIKKNQQNDDFNISMDNAIEIQIKVKHNGLIKKIIFESNITIYNNMKYPLVLVYNNEQNADGIDWEKQKKIEIRPNAKVKIPIDIIHKKYKVYAAIKKNDDQSNFIPIITNLVSLRNIREIIGQIGEAQENNTNPHKQQIERNHSTITNFTYKNQNIFTSIDLMINKSPNDKIRSINKDTLIMYDSLKTYSYYYIINQPFLFENQIPYSLSIEFPGLDNAHKLSLDPLNMISVYLLNPHIVPNIIVNMTYGSHHYKSTEFTLFDDDIKIGSNLQSIELLGQKSSNEDEDIIEQKPLKQKLNCRIKYISNEIPNNIYNPNMHKHVKYYSSMKKIIFYFDYLIVNKTPRLLYAKESKEKNKDQRDINGIFYNDTTSLFSADTDKLQLKTETSEWSKPFQSSTFGVSGVCSLSTKMKEEDFSYNTDVAVIISSSYTFKYSTVITFEQRYLIVNKLGFPIDYKQYYTDFPFDKVQWQKSGYKGLLNNDQMAMLSYVQIKKGMKKMIQISLNGKDYSAPFSIDEIQDIDLKIVYNESHGELSDNAKVYQYDNSSYLWVKVVIYSYDNGLIYIVLTNPEYPEFQIRNETTVPVTIMQKKVDSHMITIEPNDTSPFTWVDYLKADKSVICTIDNKTSCEVNFAKIETTKVDIQGRIYFLKIAVENLNKTRTLRITMLRKKTDEEVVADQIILHKRKGTNKKMVMSLKGIGFSVIDDEPKEVFYISCYKIDLRFSHHNIENEQRIITADSVMLFLKNFQIDYCLEDSFKSLIVPKHQILPSYDEDPLAQQVNQIPFIQILMSKNVTKYIEMNETTTTIPQVDFAMQEINVNIDHFCLLTFLNLQSQLMQQLDFYIVKKGIEDKSSMIIKDDNDANEHIIICNSPEFYDPQLKNEIEIPEGLITKNTSDMLIINLLMISAMKINVTFRLDLKMIDMSILPGIVVKIITSLGNSLARISDSPLKFREMIHMNVFTSLKRIITLLIKHFMRQGITEFYKIIGSIDLLGNPIGFVDKIGTGFIEFFNEPRKGFINGPRGFGTGLAKGLNSLISNLVGGGFGVVEKISGTLLVLASNMKDDKYEDIREENEPDNIIEGIFGGLKAGVMELVGGVTGIFVNPYKQAKTEGVKGFFKGLGSGIVGAVVSPFCAALRITNQLAIGMKNTAYMFSDKLKTLRYRHPRRIEKILALKPYDETLAIVQAILRLFDQYSDSKIVFYQGFITQHYAYEGLPAMIILTDKNLLVIYDMKEIIFNLELIKLKKCEAHNIDKQSKKENYALIFVHKDDTQSYISMSDIVLCTKLYSILQKSLIK